MGWIREYLPFAVFATGMAVEAYFLPWLFVAQIIFFAIFVALKKLKGGERC